ncbi:MAG: DUF1772 domain-containing protein, partial [Caulobacterales bacterium]|nr:DUF1772 domain-containing protein [Caulobacterales bacterium]
MTSSWIVYACLLLGLTSALVAGVFGAFSSFVMRGLVRAAPAGGVQSMQQINVTVMRSQFLFSFLALVPASIVFAGYVWLSLEGPGARFILAAAVVYVATVFLVTVFGNVPMNNRLARLPHGSPEAADYWRIYGDVWTRWNHVRT